MTQQEFERKIKKLLPSVSSITYGRELIGNKFIFTEVFVYSSHGCELETGKDCLDKFIKKMDSKK